MFGAPFGGTTRAGQAGFDWAALRLIWPSNFCGGGGMYRPSIVVVASGEPVHAGGLLGAHGAGGQ
jgi:hypothetical protein